MLTRYVKSPEEVQRLQGIYAAPSFLQATSLSMTFLTDPAVVRELLPPPLEPAAEPRVSVAVYQIGRSNCVGAFDGASVNVACRFNGEDGLYCLTMPMSTDTAILFGRELYAEPKKLAECRVEQRGRFVHGTVTRHGITYIDLTGTFDEPLASVERSGTTHHYYFKYLPAADGRGLAADPQLVRVTHRGITHRVARGTGTITFRESPHDPVIDLPVLMIEGAALSESETHTTAEVVATVKAADFLPWAYGKTDDFTVWADAGVLAQA
jgi:acetoacetate decarboxylase